MRELDIIGRKKELFLNDLATFDSAICDIVRESKFLVIGGGGTIGQAVVKEIFKRNAKCLHVVDLNESYLAELVRDIRSSFGYETVNFDTFALDCGTENFQKFLKSGRYDYVLNLSAMKHVRSEHSPYSMDRMIESNILNVLRTYESSLNSGVKKYFCVSTDKASNPANFMGATKRAMELCLMTKSNAIPISGARFANVAFSNGSLLESFRNRVQKLQPLSTPNDVRRYFITPKEAGIICIFSTILGGDNEIFFPNNFSEIKLTNFSEIAKKYLQSIGKTMVECGSEDQARSLMTQLDLERFWPVNLFKTDTTGEKQFEEFYTQDEQVKSGKFNEIACVQLTPNKSKEEIDSFLELVSSVDPAQTDSRSVYLNIFKNFIPSFSHVETQKFLNSRM